MFLTGVLVCKGYDDYLKETIGRNVRELDRLIVVTSEQDTATQELALAHGATVMLSPHISGDAFPKGKALSDVLAGLTGWVLVFDADVVLPEGFHGMLSKEPLDTERLYYTKRIEPRGYHHLIETLKGLRKGYSTQRIMKELMRVSEEDFHPWGYFQLCHTSALPDPAYPGESEDGSKDDTAFADRFGSKLWSALQPAFEVLHLHHGRMQTNWKGRRSPRIEEIEAMPLSDVTAMSVGDYICSEKCQYAGRVWRKGEKLRDDSKMVPRFFEKEYATLS